MPRVKRGTVRRAKRKKLLGLAKGYYANKSKLYRAAKESVDTALKYAFVGRRRKNSVLAEWMERLAAASPAEKRTLGQATNALKRELEARWTTFIETTQASAAPADAVDVTLPGRPVRLGHRHPLTIVRSNLEEI